MPSFDDFRESLQRLGGVVDAPPEQVAIIGEIAGQIQDLPTVSAKSLSSLVESNAETVWVLGLCAGLSQEQLKNVLRQWFDTSSFRKVASNSAADLVTRLDKEFNLLGRLRAERNRKWTFADIVTERFRSRSRAAGAIARGRGVEDQVEAVVQRIGLPYEMRTRFEGRRGESGPADLAIPSGGLDALIVCAIKGFDSTGSKLTDAASEIARMAEVRRPAQYVLAVVDGIGWISRQSDLRRIHELREQQAIDGLYTLSQLGTFGSALKGASKRLGLG